MADNIIFKKSLAGFDKKEVLEYIDAAAIKAKKAEEEFSRQLNEMKNQNQSLEEQTKHLQEQVSSHESKNEQLEQLIHQLEDEIAQEKETLSAKQQDLTCSIKRNLELENTLAIHKEKSRKYDEISSQLSQTILHAQKTADDMIAEAQETSDDIIKASVIAKENLKKRMEHFSKDVADLKYCINEAFVSIDRQMDEMSAAVEQCLSQLQDEVEDSSFAKGDSSLF